MHVDSLEMSIRSHNGLRKAGITTVEQLVALSYKELSSIDNIGEKSVSEICWACIELLNGKMLESIKEYEEYEPESIFSGSVRRAKLDRYKKIMEIIDSDKYR